MLPHYDGGDEINNPYDVTTLHYKVVSEYTGLNFKEIEYLMLDDFLLLQRDAFIYKQMQSKEGREYLENCKRLETTSADYSKLKEFRKGRESG